MHNNNESTKKHDDAKEEMIKWNTIERASRILYLNDPIDKDTAFKVNKTLLMLDEIANNPIKIFVNSPGGEVNSGFFIYDCIKFVRSPVYIIGAGLVASAAALIYLSVDKQYRYSLPHARYMLHQPMSGSRGVVTDLEIHAKEVDELKALINKIIAEATGNSISKIEADTDRDFWLNAEDAKNYGVVNTIVSNKDEMLELFPLPQPKKEEDDKKKSSTTKISESKNVSGAKKPSTRSSSTTKAKPKGNAKTKDPSKN